MNQMTFSGRQQVLLRSGLQTDDVYEIQWVSAKGRPVNRIKSFEDDEAADPQEVQVDHSVHCRISKRKMEEAYQDGTPLKQNTLNPGNL